MTYNKPEIAVLGDAASIIQGGKGGNPPESAIKPLARPLQPAYDLDE